MCKGPGKRGHIVADTLLLMMFLGLCKLGNICCGPKMILNKIRNTFCVPFLCLGHKICVRNKCCARGQTGKHFCRQQCVRNNVSSSARALTRKSGKNVQGRCIVPALGANVCGTFLTFRKRRTKKLIFCCPF